VSGGNVRDVVYPPPWAAALGYPGASPAEPVGGLSRRGDAPEYCDMARSRRRRSEQSGFTLIEVVVTVAIVSVLAAIALPSFTSQSRKAKGDAEVGAFFAELRTREEQYAVENGKFLSTGTSESNMFPTTPAAAGQTLGTLPTTWQSLKIRTPEDKARCSYVVVGGTKTDAAGSIATTSFAYTPPAKNWFYVLARCDLDNDSTVDSYYFVSNDAATIQKINYGR
jgi:prepilin-type N-terminal cleavage/methylation domain-containing protein